MMEPRLNHPEVAPEMLKAMTALEMKIRAGGLEHALVELVKTRASQINGCAYCLHMHTRDALAAGESATRLFLLDAWRESPLFTPRERAALAWTEALTRVAETGAPDAEWDGLAEHFDDREKTVLTWLITAINAWNRIAVGFRNLHPEEAGDLPDEMAAAAAQ